MVEWEELRLLWLKDLISDDEFIDRARGMDMCDDAEKLVWECKED
jgi:hypothetical protein